MLQRVTCTCIDVAGKENCAVLYPYSEGAEHSAVHTTVLVADSCCVYVEHKSYIQY